jgi:hypothetical protein
MQQQQQQQKPCQHQECHLAVCPETILHTTHTITMSEEARLQVNSSITVKNKRAITYNTQDKVISLIRNKTIWGNAGTFPYIQEW